LARRKRKVVGKIEIVILVGVVFIALFVQLLSISQLRLKFDQSQVLYLIWDFFEKGEFPVHGILNSRQAYNPPFFVWLYIIPSILFRDYRIVLSLPAFLFCMTAIAVLFIIGRRYFNYRMGLVAAILYAFSPLGLYFGHSSWAQGVTPHLFVLVIILLALWLLEGKRIYVAFLIPLTAWITGMHWAGALIFGVIILAAAIFRVQVSLKFAVLGLVLSLVFWTPYLIFEHERAYFDILAIFRDTSIAPAPVEVTSKCPPEDHVQPTAYSTEDVDLDESLIDRTKNIIQGGWSEITSVLIQVKTFLLNSIFWFINKIKTLIWGVVRALHSNFVRNPFAQAAGSSREIIFHYLGTGLFLLGLGILLYRQFVIKNSTPQEKILLLVFAIPILFQNISPFTSLFRPDVTWLFYGSQILIIAYALTVPQWSTHRIVQIIVILMMSILIYLSLSDVWGNMIFFTHGEGSSQSRMVKWIAEDMHHQDRKVAEIRYDYLIEKPQDCWVVSYATLNDRYRFGTENDYLLMTLYGIHNSSQALDGWAENPDYIVIYPEGIDRYKKSITDYQVADLDGFIVLKTSK